MWYFLSSSGCYSQFCPRQSLPSGYPSLLHIHNNAHLQLHICAHHQFFFFSAKHLHCLLFCRFKEAPDSAFQNSSQPCFYVDLEYQHSWLMCSWHFSHDHSGFDLTGWLLSSVGHSWSHRFPGGHFVLSRAPVSGPLLPSLATHVQFSIPEILPLYLSILTFVFKCFTYN